MTGGAPAAALAGRASVARAGVPVIALGDSCSCGQGVGLRVPPEQTWPALLATAVPGGRLHALARAGARVRDVRREQLPAALALLGGGAARSSASGGAQPPAGAVVTLLAGLNDVPRAGFDPDQAGEDLTACVAALRGHGATVVLGRLHDPTAALLVPARLRRAVQARVRAINTVVDALLGPDVVPLDLGRIPALTTRHGYAVDRLHPHPATHALLAACAVLALRGTGWPVDDVEVPTLPSRAPGSLEQARWLGRHGLPWLVERRREITLPLLRMARGR